MTAAIDGQLWIVIPRWDEFQHRDMARSSTPPWIKFYTRLLHDDDYLGLTGDQRAILHGLWLEYASSRRRLRLDTRSLSARLRLRVTTAQLKTLNHAGFITFSASRPASKVAGLEVEVDVEGQDQNLNPQTETQPELSYDTLANGSGLGDLKTLKELVATHIDMEAP